MVKFLLKKICLIIPIVASLLSCYKNPTSVRGLSNQNMKYNISFNTAYHQFHIVDKGVVPNINSDKFWTEEAFADRLAIGEGILGISTESYGPVEGELYILDSINKNPEIENADHVVEAGIQIKSGVLQIVDCPNGEVELEVKVHPGDYKIRVYSLNLATVDGDEGDDYYILEIWPDRDKERTVLKAWSLPRSG